MVGIDQKDSYGADSGRVRLRFRQWHVRGWFCWSRCISCCVPSFGGRPDFLDSAWSRLLVLLVTHSHLHADRGRLPSYFYVRGGLVTAFHVQEYKWYFFGLRLVALVCVGRLRAVLGLGCCCVRRGSKTGAVVQTVVPLQFIEGRRPPCCTAEADPHDPGDHRGCRLWPQLLLVEKFVVCPEVLTVLFIRTSECSGTARGWTTGAWCCQCKKLWRVQSCRALIS